MLKVAHLLFAFLFLSAAVFALTSDSEDEEECGDDETCVSSVKEGSSEFHSTNYKNLQKAWSAATTIPNRDPEFIRVDRFGNIIVGRKFSKNSHLSWIALFNEESEGFWAVQNEYYGKGSRDNHESALKYKAKDQTQQSFLDLLEIGLRGHLQDSNSAPSCWTPSEVHQSLMRFDTGALYWHDKLFNVDKCLGMYGHTTIFGPMEVYLKRNVLPEQALRTSNPLKTLMVVYNNKLQCSTYLDTFDAPENSDKVKLDVKNNWGLPRVAPFLKHSTAAKMTIPPNKVVKATKKIVTTATPVPSVDASISSYRKALSTPSQVSQHKKSQNYDKDFPALDLGAVLKKKK
jgi:hypothetical protein